MDINALLNDKAIKPKEKTEALSHLVADGSVSIADLISFAEKAKDPVKATCIESLEFATRQSPALGTVAVLDFAVANLAAKAPRVKWESAKVIGNIAHLHAAKLDNAVNNLIVNTEHEGTVVRWSAAFALGEILKLKTTRNKDLLPAIEAICQREEKNSIRKIYLGAIKKTTK